MSERLARRLKAHYHIAIQFDEPKDDNAVRYAVKKHFQVKATGYTLSRHGMVFPNTLPISTKGYPEVVPVMIGSYDGHVTPDEYYQMHLSQVEELKKAQALRRPLVTIR